MTRPSEAGQPGPQIYDAATPEEARLRRENEELKRRVESLSKGAHGSSHSGLPTIWRPSAITIWAIFLAAAVLIALGFAGGYIPMRKRQAALNADVQEQE